MSTVGSTAGSDAAASPMVAPPGLKGVVVADTAIGDVRGAEGYYHYRGRSATALATQESFEANVATVVFGDPADGGTDMARCLGRLRIEAADRLDEWGVLRSHSGDPMVAARALVSQWDPRANLDLGRDEQASTLLSIAAAIPVIFGRLNYPHLRPDPSLGHAADTVRLISGRAPQPAAANAVERYLSLTLDHGFNASTFAARAVASTGADLGGVMASAMASLSGPLHGGAPGRVAEMWDEIGDPTNTEAWLRCRLARGDKIMGFGHAVYRGGDPRTPVLRQAAQQLGGPLVERAVEIESRTLAVLRDWKPTASIETNVEYYAALVLRLAGIDQGWFTPVFTSSRAFGWAAHVLEQLGDNKIIRPSAQYLGAIDPG